MPWLDIGDLPDSYSNNKQEAFQVFMVPKGQPDVTMVIPYDSFHGHYDILMARMKYSEFDFDERNISYEDVEDTLK